MADFDFLASHAESLPDKPAVILGDRTLDFATLNRRANRAANAFKRTGGDAGDRVAIMSFNSIEGSEVGNGARRLGMIVVPVNYRLRGSEIAYVLNDSAAKIVVAGPDHVDAVEGAREEIKGDRRFIAVGDHVPSGLAFVSRAHGWRIPTSRRPSDGGNGIGASMIYTSGTTGHPKGGVAPTWS